MVAEVNEFIEEQMKGLAELAAKARKSPVDAARRAATESATRIKSLNGRVRELARSGVRLSVVSHGAVQDLIELQSDIVTTALDEAAKRIERMVHTENVRDLARLQGEALQAARQRIVADITRAVTILRNAAGQARTVAPKAKRAKAPSRKKTTRRVAKTKAKTRRAVKAKTKTVGRGRRGAAAKVRKTARRARAKSRS
jgi:hypothetical protein